MFRSSFQVSIDSRRFHHKESAVTSARFRRVLFAELPKILSVALFLWCCASEQQSEGANSNTVDMCNPHNGAFQGSVRYGPVTAGVGKAPWRTR